MPQPDKVETAEECVEVITEAGYTNVVINEHHGNTWHCSATNAQGQQVNILVDGAGKVHEKGSEEEPDAVEPEPEPKSG